MPRSTLLPLVALLALLSTPAGSAAQVGIPGRGIEETRGLRGEYLTFAMRGIRETLGEWSGAWRAGEPGRLGELYAADARLLPPSGARELRGPDEIAAYWSSGDPAFREVALALDDFDVSAGLAFVQGTYETVRAGSDGGEERSQGVHLTVLVMEGRSWRIRSQLFRSCGAPGQSRR